MSKKKPQKLSVFLLKETITDATSALKSTAGLKRADFCIDDQIAPLYYKENHPAKPAWTDFFEPQTEELDQLRNKSTAAVFFVESSERLFALTFGYGKALLLSSCLEENFGFRVVLNVVDPEEIRSADAQTLDAIPIHKRTQAGVSARITEMGVNAEEDLLHAVTGKPKDSTYGPKITGKDALAITVSIKLEALPNFLGKLYREFLATAYKTYFPWVDNLSEVRDKVLCGQLDATLGQKISNRDFRRTWLAIPEVIDWEDHGCFKYQKEKTGSELEDIDWRSYLDSLRGDVAINAELFKKQSVLHISESSESVIHHWPVYRCIYCELKYADHSYLLTSGKWYRIKPEFVTSINNSVNAIRINKTLKLPDYEDKDERAYNVRVAEGNKQFILLDRKNVHHGGRHNQIEFCDLYCPSNKQMLHVKRYAGSSVLSHLFAQGVTSAELLLMDETFRSKVNKMLPPSHALPSGKPRSADYEVIYVVLSKALSRLDELPLLSKITLRNSHRRLEAMGFRVSVCAVPVS